MPFGPVSRPAGGEAWIARRCAGAAVEPLLTHARLSSCDWLPWNQLASNGPLIPAARAVDVYCQKVEYVQSPNRFGLLAEGVYWAAQSGYRLKPPGLPM